MCVRESIMSGQDVLKMHQPWREVKESLGSKEDRVGRGQIVWLEYPGEEL